MAEQHDVSTIGDAAIRAVLDEMGRVYNNVHRTEQSFGGNDGFETDFFGDLKYRSYNWGEDADAEHEMTPNLEFGGVRIWWYKWAVRGTRTEREMTSQEWSDWLDAAMSHVRSLDAF